MVQAKLGDTVKVNYTGKLQDGTVFDSSVNRDPLQFSLGQGQVIAGFEEAIVGMSPGDNKSVTIPSEQAYGPYQDELVIVVDEKQMPSDLSVEVGQQLQMRHSSGQAVPVMVTNIAEDKVTLDANHPLAGKDLTFDIELVNIQ
ncbi:putative FKBP-type peptidyl-prolyl cis-trans isomerase [Crocosphaera subtropica ATCC 51142]|uniref:Peptidyl-prolyl cis-trans isomerase n=1 Tax=Crocosphaera subtropica (strain ATCC 51142 / BH68) TaxID=43989 RepID=B1X1P2_CROS5|nr:peptidylprolyl isomerase [Crocosphaera subtropica]ACB53072.1 putative FKBP-type peptidyl-prolyl cis-trans isomerase [Crocosphaera subtropica ATCC 51142]